MYKKMKQQNNNSEFSEDWLPVKQIMNGMIQTEDGEVVTGVKVMPKNIFILDNVTQNATIQRLETFYNTLDYEFWLIIADRPVDITSYLSNLQQLYTSTTDQVKRKLIMQDINKGNMFMSTQYNVVDTEYYILFKESKMELIQKKLYNLMSGLANSGMQSVQTSNEDLRMILDNFLNDGAASRFGTVS